MAKKETSKFKITNPKMQSGGPGHGFDSKSNSLINKPLSAREIKKLKEKNKK